MKISLYKRILNYYRRNSGVWISGGEIERLVANRTTYKASNASRRLRELENDGLIERKDVKGTVYYRYIPQQVTVERVRVEDGVAVRYQETIKE